MVHIRKAYDEHDPAEYATHIEGESLTQQHYTDSCNINNILEKYRATGVIDHFNPNPAHYALMTGDQFTENMFLLAEAQRMFNELPSGVREHFGEDPAKYMDYVNGLDENSDRKELFELGMLDTPPAETPVEHPAPEAPVEAPQATENVE